MASSTRSTKQKKSVLSELDSAQIADDADFPVGYNLQKAREEDIPWIDSSWPDHISHGMLPVSVAAVRCGLRFPIHPFIKDVLNHLQLPLYALFPSAWLCFVAFLYYSFQSSTMPTLVSFFTLYAVSTRRGKGKLSGWKLFYFHDRARAFSLVEKEDSQHAWFDSFFWVIPPSQGQNLESVWGIPIFVTPDSGLMRDKKKFTPLDIKKIFCHLTRSGSLLSRSELLEPSRLKLIFTPLRASLVRQSDSEETSSSSQSDHRKSGAMVKRKLVREGILAPWTHDDSGGIFPSDPIASLVSSGALGDSGEAPGPLDPNPKRPCVDIPDEANIRSSSLIPGTTPTAPLDIRWLSFLNGDSELSEALKFLTRFTQGTERAISDLFNKEAELRQARDEIKQLSDALASQKEEVANQSRRADTVEKKLELEMQNLKSDHSQALLSKEKSTIFEFATSAVNNEVNSLLLGSELKNIVINMQGQICNTFDIKPADKRWKKIDPTLYDGNFQELPDDEDVPPTAPFAVWKDELLDHVRNYLSKKGSVGKKGSDQGEHSSRLLDESVVLPPPGDSRD